MLVQDILKCDDEKHIDSIALAFESWMRTFDKGSWFGEVARMVAHDFCANDVHSGHEFAILIELGKFHESILSRKLKNLPPLKKGDLPRQGFVDARHLVRRFALQFSKGSPDIDERHLLAATTIIAYVNSR